MVRGAAISFVVIMLLTTVATWLMLTGTVNAQQAPRHVFSGSVLNAGDAVYEGHVSFLDKSGHEVATGNVNNGRYKIAVLEVAGRNYSGQTFQITVRFQNRIYERAQRVNWQAGGVTTLDLEFGTGSGWRWHQAPSQGDQRRMEEDQRRMDQNDEDRDRRMEMDQQRMDRESLESNERMGMERQRMEMEQQRMESEEKLRREQMKMQVERQEREEEERRDMSQQKMEEDQRRMDQNDEDRNRRMEMDQQRLEREEEERKERMEMDRQRMAMEQQRMGQQRMVGGQPGAQPVAGERPKSGPGRGLFSNSKAGEATSGIDNIMDPGMLTIIGIALTVLTTGMTLFKGD